MTRDDDQDGFARGLEMRRAVMGQSRIESSLLGPDDIGHDLQMLTTEFAWGEVWNREGLNLRTRSAITISMLIALNRSAELKAHIHGALNNGMDISEIKEVVIHSAVYCGFPAALESMRQLRTVLQERDE